MSPDSQPEVACSLLAYLRSELRLPDLAYAEPPVRLLGGCQTFVYGFRLEGAIEPYDQRLVVRILRSSLDHASVRFETAVQDTLIELGYPTPCVLAYVEDAAVLGGAFQVMERLGGRPLILDGFDPEQSDFVTQLRTGIRSTGELVFGDWPVVLARLHADLHALDAGRLLGALETAGVSCRRASLETRLDALESRLETGSAGALRRAVGWLRTERPACNAPVSILHGDFFANQVFREAGAVSGVIDWTEAFVAPAEIDVGIVKAGFETVPIPLPAPLRRAGERLTAWLAHKFVGAYGRLRPLNAELVRYGEALRCVDVLVGIDSRRRLLAGGATPTSIGLNPFDHPLGVRRLCDHLASVSGLVVPEHCIAEPA